MTVAGAIVVPRASSGPDAAVAAAAAAEAGVDVVVVVGDERLAPSLPPEATVLLDRGTTAATGLRAAIDWIARSGFDAVVAVVVEPGSIPAAADAAAWRTLAAARAPFAELMVNGAPTGMFRLDESFWPLVPLAGEVLAGLRVRAAPDRVEIDRTASSPAGARIRPRQSGTRASHGAEGAASTTGPASTSDVARVTELLGRRPEGAFSVVVRDARGGPVVIENAPFLDDGTPMPTRYWLVGRTEREAVGRLEAAGGVRALEASIDAAAIADAHARYARARDALIDPAHTGPRPTGGVGGTRRGLKCLHAHLAWYLAGGRDPVGRAVALRLADEIEGPVAAIDCGTNSTRLLVLGRDGAVLERRMVITRLGEGVDTHRRLSATAIERTLAVLREYRDVMDDHGVVRQRATATSAVRDASNREDFSVPAATILGTEPVTLAGDEEGRLSFAGATKDLAGEGPFVVVDVGGGSTEFAADVGDDVAAVSLDVGCVRVTERYLAHDPPEPEELAAASQAVGAVVARLRADRPELVAGRTVVAVAGTVATLATRAAGLASYDGAATHGTVVRRAVVESELATLASLAAAERAALPGIEPARADVIVGGLVVVRAVLAELGAPSLVYSERDILDGVAASLIAPGATSAPTWSTNPAMSE